jgi:hypothetical protein
MRNNSSLLIIVLLFWLNNANAQFHVSGFVNDKQTGERLIGATIIENGTTNGTSTDNNGYFSLITRSNSIKVSFIGYKTTETQLLSDTLLHIVLESGELLNEITVKGEQSKRFNISTLSHKEILSIPSLGGKPDVLKALQLLPGIQSQTEGSSLLNVRGGNPGENLYLIDNIPLIYVNHLGGFTSVFNPDMINNIEVYKGGFPARYGGKLSSIIAITQREGDKSGLKGSLGIGVTDISFSLEGPLLKKKASFMVTGRKTMTDALMLLFTGLSSSNNNYVYYGFHDINGKFSWQPNNNNSLYLNFYQGDDYFGNWNKDYREKKEKYSVTNTWGNWMTASRWNRVISPRLFVDNSFSYTRYRLNVASSYQTIPKTDTTGFTNYFRSSVNDFSLRTDWKYKLLKNWDIDFGAKATSLTHTPNEIYQSGLTEQADYEVVNSFETNVYLNNAWQFSRFIDAHLGMRLVNYHSGSFNQVVFEPRVNINANLSVSQSVNFSYQKVNQFAHLLFTQGSIMNNEVWIPANERMLPANSIQYSLGWKGNFFNENFNIEANVYYKMLNQLATYREGYSSLMGDGSWRSKIESGGSGTAKGVELLIKKTKGSLTGFVSYTYSTATRQFSEINKGEEYLFDYDRPHSLSINLNRTLSDKWSVNATWIYQTGLPYTPVIGRQIKPLIESNGIYLTEGLIYGKRNSARMKDYHRLDLGLTYTTKTPRGNKAVWNFSVYNAYNRHNPMGYFYGYDKDGAMNYNQDNYKPLKQYQTSMFPIIPTLSYKVFFEGKSERKPKTSLKQKIKNYFNYAY